MFHVQLGTLEQMSARFIFKGVVLFCLVSTSLRQLFVRDPLLWSMLAALIVSIKMIRKNHLFQADPSMKLSVSQKELAAKKAALEAELAEISKLMI